jgi:hypothetical protein
MGRYISTTIAIALMLGLSACSTAGQGGQSTHAVLQQRRACTQGDQHPWCMQMAQTRPLGAAPYGLENTGPANPEMRDDNTPYPTNPALPLITPGIGGIRMMGL